MVSPLSPHNRHLLFCCLLSILSLIWLFLMALFCAAIRRDSVSLLKFPFLSYVLVLLFEMLFMSRLNAIELFFFPFLFPSYCHRVVSIVSGGYNLSCLVLFYVVLVSLYRCVNVVFNAGNFSSSLLFVTYGLSTSSVGCNALWVVDSFLVLWSI